jgi:octaprenyl-diphosphate synthase
MKKGDIGLQENEYMDIIRGKTAVLFEGACRVSARISDAVDEKEAAIARYGHHLGMAFQIADDLFDYTLETRQLGKKVGADLREGKMTLPLIYALKHAPASERGKMERIAGSPDFNEAMFHDLVKCLDQYGGLQYSRALAAQHLDTAKSALDIFDDGETRTTLQMLADYVLLRNV